MIDKIISKKIDIKTPWLIKIVAILNFISVISVSNRMFRYLMNSEWIDFILLFVSALLSILILVAFWNMRRWAVLALVIMALRSIPFLMEWSEILSLGSDFVIYSFLWRILLILPGFVYWKRMTW